MTMAKEAALKALNKLAKWRMVLAGWQLGTRPKGEPECEAVRDHRESTLVLRAELSAVTGLLLKKGIFTEEELQLQMKEEAEELDKAYERFFPGIRTVDDGIIMDPAKASETMKGWKP